MREEENLTRGIRQYIQSHPKRTTGQKNIRSITTPASISSTQHRLKKNFISSLSSSKKLAVNLDQSGEQRLIFYLPLISEAKKYSWICSNFGSDIIPQSILSDFQAAKLQLSVQPMCLNFYKWPKLRYLVDFQDLLCSLRLRL